MYFTMQTHVTSICWWSMKTELNPRVTVSILFANSDLSKPLDMMGLLHTHTHTEFTANRRNTNKYKEVQTLLPLLLLLSVAVTTATNTQIHTSRLVFALAHMSIPPAFTPPLPHIANNHTRTNAHRHVSVTS